MYLTFNNANFVLLIIIIILLRVFDPFIVWNQQTVWILGPFFFDIQNILRLSVYTHTHTHIHEWADMTNITSDDF